MREYLLLLPATLCAATPALAVTAAAPPADDATIIVTASGTEQPVVQTGQAITVLTSDTIRQRQTPIIADLIATTPGISFTSNGGIGGVTTVRIRGAEGEQTLVLIDGVRFNDPAAPGGGYNFGGLLTGNIDRIEILRGPNSVIWGSQAIGGVIDLRTIEPTEALAFTGRAEYGSRGQAQIVGNVSGKAGPVSASVGAGWFRTDGVSAFAGGSERDGYRNFGANAKVKVELAEGIELDLRGFYSDGKNGYDGFPAPAFVFADTDDETRTRELLGYAGLNAALFDGRFRNRIAYSRSDIDRENSDPGATPRLTFESRGIIERFEYQGIFDAADALTLIGGASSERSRLRTASPSSFDPTPTLDRAKATIDSLYAQAIVRPFTGLSLTGGARYDDHSDFGGETTFGANVAYTPNDGATVLRGTYAEGFKAPTLFQLLSDFGNRLLQPERARSYDIGIEQQALDGRISATVTYFRRKTRNQIDFISCFDQTGICTGRPFGTYDNIARTEAEGVELALMLRPTDGFDVQAQYTFTDTENVSPGSANFGNVLPRRPKDSVSVAADYRFPFGLSLGGTVRHADDSFDNASNSRRLDGYVLVDIRAAMPVLPGVEVYARAENLFDEQYQTAFGFGTIGRGVFAGVRLSY